MSDYSLAGLTMEELGVAATAVAALRNGKETLMPGEAASPSRVWSEANVREFVAGIGENFKRFLTVVAENAPKRVQAPDVHSTFRMADGSKMPEPAARGAFGGFSQRVKKVGRAPWLEEWNGERGFMEYWMADDVAALVLRAIGRPSA